MAQRGELRQPLSLGGLIVSRLEEVYETIEIRTRNDFAVVVCFLCRHEWKTSSPMRFGTYKKIAEAEVGFHFEARQ